MPYHIIIISFAVSFITLIEFNYPNSKLFLNLNKELNLPFYSEFIIYTVSACILLASLKISRNRKKLIKNVKQNNGFSKISWQEFEELTGQLFKIRGYHAEVIGGSGGDGGIDVFLKRGKKKWVVQCKHWKSKKIGVNIVREMYGVMHDQNADGVKIVTSGEFTKPCYQFIKNKPIELIDGKKLFRICKGQI